MVGATATGFATSPSVSALTPSACAPWLMPEPGRFEVADLPAPQPGPPLSHVEVDPGVGPPQPLRALFVAVARQQQGEDRALVPAQAGQGPHQLPRLDRQSMSTRSARSSSYSSGLPPAGSLRWHILPARNGSCRLIHGSR
jgi:hypothetical protein